MKTSTPSNIPQIQSNTAGGQSTVNQSMPAQSFGTPNTQNQSTPAQSFNAPTQTAQPAPKTTLPTSQAAPTPTQEERALPVSGEERKALADSARAKRESALAKQKTRQEEKASTTPTSTETTTTVNPDGSKTTESKQYSPEAEQYKNVLDQNYKTAKSEYDYATARFNEIARDADDAQKNLIAAINTSYQVRLDQMETVNEAALNSQQLLGARSGRSRYAPELQRQILSAEERNGIRRLTEIEAERLTLISQAQTAATQEDLLILNNRMEKLSGLRDEQQKTVLEMYSLARTEETRAQQRATFEIDLMTKMQTYDQTQAEFEREEVEYNANYLAQNLLNVLEDGTIESPTPEEIVAISTDYGIDPNILLAKVNQYGRELETYDITTRGNILANQKAETENLISRFNLSRAQTLLPYEIEEMALANAKTEDELAEATEALEDGELDAKTMEELIKNQTYKDLKGNELLFSAIKNYKEKFEEFTNGGKNFDILSREEKAELASLKSGLTATLKDAKTLGTLDAGVERVVNGLIGELPDSGLFPSIGLFIGAQNKMKSALEQVKQETEVKYNQLINENPAYANSKAVNSLYRRVKEIPSTYEEWADNAKTTPEDIRKLGDAVIDVGGDPNSPEDLQEAWEALYGESFNKPLSMGKKSSMTDVSKIKDFSRVVTSVGKGTATGIEGGSKFWKPGFDFVLDGGKGAPVRQPFSGVVVEAGEAGGFGKSVVVQLPDGRKIRSSHLDSINVKPGQKVSSSTVLGGQGDTGKTYGKTGIHVDYTMYKPDGSTYTSQEVASFFNTKLA